MPFSDEGDEAVSSACRRELQRAREVQRANLLVRLRAERALARATHLLTVVGAEALLRSGDHEV